MDNIFATIPNSPDSTLLLVKEGCTRFMVSVGAASPHGVAVLVYGLHSDGNYVVVQPGQSQVFSWTKNRITHVVAHGNGGTASNVSYGVVGKDPGTSHDL